MPVNLTYDPAPAPPTSASRRFASWRARRVAPGIILGYAEDGRIVGIEILSASRVLAPGDWQKARRPGEGEPDA